MNENTLEEVFENPGNKEEVAIGLIVIFIQSKIETVREVLNGTASLTEEQSSTLADLLIFIENLTMSLGANAYGIENDEDFEENFAEETKKEITVNFLRVSLAKAYKDTFCKED